MDGYTEELRFQTFEEQHGLSEWQGRWGCSADGSEIEAAPLGYRLLAANNLPVERQLKNKVQFWTLRLDRLSRDFRTLKDRLQCKAASATLTQDDTAELRALQAQIREATQTLSDLENVDAVDEDEVRAAISLYFQRRRLAEAVAQGEKDYKAASQRYGPTARQSIKIGKKWQNTWDEWDSVNREYESLPDDVRREANGRCWKAEADERAEQQKKQLQEIEI